MILKKKKKIFHLIPFREKKLFDNVWFYLKRNRVVLWDCNDISKTYAIVFLKKNRMRSDFAQNDCATRLIQAKQWKNWYVNDWRFYRCSYFRCNSISRVSSDSSLNEFIKQKMQNRPPCYDDIEKDRKVPIDQIHQVCLVVCRLISRYLFVRCVIPTEYYNV